MCNIKEIAEIKQKKEEIKQFVEVLRNMYNINNEKRILKSINT